MHLAKIYPVIQQNVKSTYIYTQNSKKKIARHYA